MNINKSIFNTIIEIIFMFSFLLITIPIWNMLDKTSFAAIATSYEDYTRDDVTMHIEKHFDISNMYPIKDEERYNTNFYSLVNTTNLHNKEKSYYLYLTIDDNKTLNTNYLKISFNDEVHLLKDLKQIKLNNKTYYLINQKQIEAKGIDNYKIYIWLDKDTPNTEQAKNFNVAFEISNENL